MRNSESEDVVRPETKFKEDEEGQTPSMLRKPDTPTKEEWEKHMLTHIPCRNWCPYCVKGRGRDQVHRKKDKEGRKDIPGVIMDYAYHNEDSSKKGKRPIIMMKDQDSGKHIAHVVPRKGDDAKAIAIVSREVKKLGYGKMIWKSDQEPSIVSFKERVRKELGEGYSVVMEESPVYSHQSN